MIEEKIYNFNSHGDHRGELVALEYPKDLPFSIKRIYYIYNVPGNERRGFHSHNKLEQILIAVSGSVKILLKTPEDEKTVLLDSPKKGLYIGPMMWREMFDFSDDAVLLVLASREYDESDYIRNYEDYVKAISNMKGEGKND